MDTSIIDIPAGTDGVVPVHEPNGCWKTWSLDEVFMGGPGKNRYVPNIGDEVKNLSTGELYSVKSLDRTTMIVTLVKVVPAIIAPDMSDADLLMGVGPGTNSDTYRVYIDKSVTPHSLCVDARLYISVRDAKYVKIFRGWDLDLSGQCISAFYDQSGNLLGQEVPLELIQIVGNFQRKAVSPCSTTSELKDGDIVVVVSYSDTGGVVGKRQCLVENTGFIRTADDSQKYVSDISLETPFLSPADPRQILYPINVPLSGFNMIGVVHYSDGSKLRMPVDGTKFAMFGLQNYVATIVNQPLKLQLQYNLSPGEIAYGVTVADNKFIPRDYTAITVKADGNYSVKLYGYPVWIDSVNGYRMEWFLYNLDRKTFYHVTPYVHYGANAAPLNPIAYGALQRLVVNINLQDVNGIYKNWIHTQTLEVVLYRQGTDHSSTNWSIGFDPGQNPQYGINLYATSEFVNQNLKRIKIDFGETVFSKWLDRVYWATKPLADSSKEAKAPTPNMFAIVLEGQTIEYTIENWNSPLTINTLLADSATLYIRFFKRTPETDIQLSISAMPVYQLS